MDMWPRWSHVLPPLSKVAISTKGRTILWKYYLELAFQELKWMVSDETLPNYPDWKIPFTVHTNASNWQLGAVIIKNNKPIDLFSIKPIKQQHNCNTTEKEMISSVKCLNHCWDIFFGYEINLFSDHIFLSTQPLRVNIK